MRPASHLSLDREMLRDKVPRKLRGQKGAEMDPLSRLCAWYEGQPHEDWHEDHGVKISTVDNPGWRVLIDIEHTTLEDKEFTEVEIDRSETDWIICQTRYGRFDAACGPGNLNELIEIFLDWTASA